ncbi:MAG: CocE/NonD family hydrolase [Rhodobacteraceae bacterium]|nr:CocE/NonD family hydrolase [Paracoccaceae bacterium]
MTKRRLVLAGVTAFAVLAALGYGLRGELHRVTWLWKEHRSFQRFLAALPATRQADLSVPMPDGVRLATDVYLPTGARPPLPTILVRLPYGKTLYGEARHWVSLFAARGYAVVVQDMRGRFASGGAFAAYSDAAGDGAATLGWIAAQRWSDGKVGTIGCSALGETQVILATRRPPVLAAMIPIGAGGAAGTVGNLWDFFGLYEGGVFELASGYGWFARWGGERHAALNFGPIDYARGLAILPMRDAVARTRPDQTGYAALLDGFSDPAYWLASGFVTDADSFATPALMVDNWYDPNVAAALALSAKMRGGTRPAHADRPRAALRPCRALRRRSGRRSGRNRHGAAV